MKNKITELEIEDLMNMFELTNKNIFDAYKQIIMNLTHIHLLQLYMFNELGLDDKKVQKLENKVEKSVKEIFKKIDSKND